MAIARLDYRRELLRLGSLDFSRRELAHEPGISRPSLNDAVMEAEGTPPSRPRFSGAEPQEMCRRFALGRSTPSG